MAKLVDGVFNTRGGELEMVSGPPISRAILHKLEEIARRAKAHEITPEDAVKQAAEVAPVLGRIMGRFMVLGLPILTLLIALISLYLQYEGNRSSDEFESDALQLLERQVHAVELLAASANKEPENGVTKKSSGPTKVTPKKKPVVIKTPSKRRKNVNNARRQQHVEHKKSFPGRRRNPF
ncbi:MAG TPA: hypothetical protein VGM46_07465 [Mesorhizobium sp.]